MQTTQTPGFDFGANWQAFSEALVTEERLVAAMQSLQRLLARDRLDGASFLDIGCGSGLFAIAAHCLGADSLVLRNGDLIYESTGTSANSL